LRTGSPLAGVTVDAVGKNGLTVLSGESDAEGHVRFPSLKSFERERTPVLYSAHRGEDLSFLPIDREDRDLDLSRFDVGGVSNALLGSVTVLVREFQPDRMTMAAHLSAESADGWVSPDGLTARITLKNLFGTPAAGRRVTARVQLTPGFPTLRRLEDYRFSDPQ